MLTPHYLAECSDELIRLLGELDESIMRDFVRRLVKAGHITDAAKWQAQHMMEAGALYDDIVAEAARMTGKTETAVRELFREAGLKSVAYDINICRAAGLSPLPLAASPAAMQVLLSGMEKTKGMLDNLTMTTANGAQRAFIEAATLAEMQVESGAFDYVTAIRNAVHTAASGGAWVLYPTGARSRLDTATRRAVLTGVNQTAAALTLAYADDMGCDLVETTAHMGARPEHAVWQGQVFSRSGKSRRYPDFVTATGYGTGPGLCGWNCRHSFYMFFEGVDERAYSRAQLDEYANARVRVNGKEMPYYEATQRQRAMERRVRDTRRELAGLDGGIKAAPDEAVKNALQQDFDSVAARLKRQEAALKDFTRQAGLALDTSRVQVQGFGRSTSAKAVWAAKRGRTADIVVQGHTLYAVTDKAIQAVPKPFFKALSDGMNRKAQDYAREILRNVKDLPEGTEAAISFAIDGRLKHVFTGTGPDMRVTIRGMRQSYILLHNHASNDILSPEDILALIRHDNMVAIGAVGNKGALFTCEKVFGYNREKAVSFYQGVWGQYPEMHVNLEQRFQFMQSFMEGAEKYGLHFASPGQSG